MATTLAYLVKVCLKTLNKNDHGNCKNTLIVKETEMKKKKRIRECYFTYPLFLQVCCLYLLLLVDLGLNSYSEHVDTSREPLMALLLFGYDIFFY